MSTTTAEALSENPPDATLARYTQWAYAALRIVLGLLLMVHGIQKVAGVLIPPEHIPAVGSQMWIGGVLEMVGGALVALGLFTRVSAFILSGQMAVAYFQFHWKLDVSSWRWLPVVNQGELAVAYCFAFLYFAFAGPGWLSLDRSLRRVR